MIYVAWCFLFC